jgi:hypothetical protein
MISYASTRSILMSPHMRKEQGCEFSRCSFPPGRALHDSPIRLDRVTNNTQYCMGSRPLIGFRCAHDEVIILPRARERIIEINHQSGTQQEKKKAADFVIRRAGDGSVEQLANCKEIDKQHDCFGRRNQGKSGIAFPHLFGG